MVSRFYGYQYDTNPRKLSQDNTPIRNRYSRNDESYTQEENFEKINTRRKTRTIRDDEEDTYLFERTNRQKVAHENRASSSVHNKLEKPLKNDTETEVRAAKKTKNDIKPKLRMIMFLITGFSVLFAISYQNSLINESFNKKEQYKREMEALSKTNQQLAVSIENSLNLNNIEQVAKEKIGMQKLNNNQKIYVSLPKVDYVAPAAEQIIIEEDGGFFNKIVKGFTKSIK